jgi:hypothetical protein
VLWIHQEVEKKLYESFSKDFAKEKEYEFYTKVENDKQIFVIYKEYIDKRAFI